MAKTIFVGKMPWAMREADIAEILTNAGVDLPAEVEIKVIMEAGKPNFSRGIAFIENVPEELFDSIVKALDGYEVDNGRGVMLQLVANEARPREERR